MKKKSVIIIIVALCAAVLIGGAAVKLLRRNTPLPTEFSRDGFQWTRQGGTVTLTGEGVPGDLFETNRSVKTVVLGAGITGVSDTTFHGLEGLREITVAEDNPSLSAADGVLFSKDKTALLYYPPARPGAEYTVPDGVTVISDSAFAGQPLLRGVTMPEGLEEIRSHAFSGCEKLENARFPDSLRRVGDEAFADCAALKELFFPTDLYAIGDRAFAGCAGLAAVTLPAGLKKLGECAFRGCAGVTAFAVEKGNTVFSAADGVLFRSGGRVLYQYPRGDARKTYAAPEGVEEIAYAAFEGCALTKAALPDSLTKIGPAAFKDCAALTKAALPDHVTAIGDAAFSGCTALREVTLAKYLESIGIEAFFNCPQLKTVEVPFKVSFVGFRSLGYTALFGSNKYTEGFLLRCREGSPAQSYAERYGVPYELVTEQPG